MTPHPATASRIAVASLLAFAPVPALPALLPPAAAQSGDAAVMTFEPAPGPPLVMHMPDLRALREPDFRRPDLPIFVEKLGLDDTQRVVVRTLLEAYLLAFAELVEKSAPAPPQTAISLDLGDALKGLGGIEGLGGPGDSHGHAGVIVPVEPIEILIDGGGDGGERPDSGAGELPPDGGEAGPAVMIAITTAPGEDLPDEVRRQIEAKAREMAEKIREQLEKHLEESGAAGVPEHESMEEHEARLDELAAQAERFEAAKEALRRSFVLDVQSQLTGPQMERWPALDRTLTRLKTLPRGELDGERTDLIGLIDGLHLDAGTRAQIGPQLEAYEVDLHAALVRRNEYLRDAERRIDALVREGRPDRALSIADRVTGLRVAVRSVNERHADAVAGAIAEALSDEAAVSFRRTFQETSFPSVYRPTRAQRAFKAVTEWPDLDAEIRSLVEEIHGAYLQELERENDAIRRAILKHQPKERRQMMEQLQSMMAGETPAFEAAGTDPVRAAFRERSELDERYMKRVYALLPAERVAALQRIAALPKLPSETSREPLIIRRLSP